MSFFDIRLNLLDHCLAQQEWFLYEHIETRSTITTEEFTFRPIRQSTYLGEKEICELNDEHSLFLVTCCVARRPGYFYWNVYLLIFLITFIALTVYGVAPEYPQSRLQITCLFNDFLREPPPPPIPLISLLFRYTSFDIDHVPLVCLSSSSTCVLFNLIR